MLCQEILIGNHFHKYVKEMFTRGGEVLDDKLIIRPGETIQLDTYFNMFSTSKWKKYSVVDRLSVSLALQGRGTASLFRVNLENPEKSELIRTIEFSSVTEEEVLIANDISLDELADSCYVEITGKDGGCVFAGGGYFAENVEPTQDVRLACAFCTFRRERDITENVLRIRRDILENKNSPLFERTDVYITDNGHTLEPDMDFLCHDRVHLFRNKPTGASGGFTRGLIEAGIYNREKHSHVILMDDDAIIEGKVLERTFCFLRLLKATYHEYMVGGAFLQTDKPAVQVENGARFDSDGEIRSKGSKKELTSRNEALTNEQEEPVNYNGWYYSCIPSETITKENLPLPFFIHSDDVEYSMRFGGRLLHLNGICIWHPSFGSAGKKREYIVYFDERNKEILFTKRGWTSSWGKVVWAIWRNMIGYAFSYEYTLMDYYFWGLRDYYKGIDWLKHENAEKLNERVMAWKKSEKIQVGDIPLEELKDCSKPVKYLRKIVNMLLPSWRPVVYTNLRTAERKDFLGIKKVVLVDPSEGIGIVREKKRMEILRLMVEAAKLTVCVLKNHDRVTKEWHDRIHELETLEFWEWYLELPPRH